MHYVTVEKKNKRKFEICFCSMQSSVCLFPFETVPGLGSGPCAFDFLYCFFINKVQLTIKTEKKKNKSLVSAWISN